MKRPDMSEAVGALVDDAIARHGIDARFEGREGDFPCVFEVDHREGIIRISRGAHASEGGKRIFVEMKPSAAFRDGQATARLQRHIDAMASDLAVLERREVSLREQGLAIAPPWSFVCQPLMRHLLLRADVAFTRAVQPDEDALTAESRGVPVMLNAYLDDLQSGSMDILFHSSSTVGEVLEGTVFMRTMNVIAGRDRTTIRIRDAHLDGTLLNAAKGMPLTSLVGHPALEGMGHLKVHAVRVTDSGLTIDIRSPNVTLGDVPEGCRAPWRETTS